MLHNKKLSILLLTLLIVGCGFRPEPTNVVKKPKAAEVVSVQPKATKVDACVKSADGTLITSSSGVCWTSETVTVPIVESKPVEEDPCVKSSDGGFVLDSKGRCWTKKALDRVRSITAAKAVPPPPPPAPAPPKLIVDAFPTDISGHFNIATAAGTEDKIKSKPKAKPKKAAKKIEVSAPKLADTKVFEPVPKAKPEDILQQLSQATIVFNLPDKINIEEVARAELLIDFTKEEKELAKELTTSGVVTSGKILVSKVVTAKLVAPNFSVYNITPEKQALSNTAVTQWFWELTPTKTGKQEIILSISARVVVDEEGVERYIGTYNKTLSVEITPIQTFSSWIDKYWQWILTTIFVPWAFWRWKTRKERKPQNSLLRK